MPLLFQKTIVAVVVLFASGVLLLRSSEAFILRPKLIVEEYIQCAVGLFWLDKIYETFLENLFGLREIIET